MNTAVRYVNYIVPGNSVPVKNFVNAIDDAYFTGDIDRDDLVGIYRNYLGIEKIHIDEKSNESGHFTELLNDYFSRTKTDPADIDFIVYTRGNSISKGDPWCFDKDAGECVNTPYFLQKVFTMSNAQIFNVEQECSGTLIATRIVLSLIRDNVAKKALILSSNFFETAIKRTMTGMSLVSDGVGIMEISRCDSSHDGYNLIDHAGMTNGAIAKVTDLVKDDNPGVIVSTGVKLLKTLVEKNGLSMNDIALIIPQNINKSGWNYYCQVLGYPIEKVFLDNCSDGHMGDVDIIRNIADARKNNRLEGGAYALVYGLGTGLSWNAFLLQAC